MNRYSLLIMVPVLLLALCGAGCDRKGAVAVGASAPDFSANDSRGNRISLTGMRGKPVILYFWRNTCCGENLKRVEPLYRRLKADGVELVAVNVGDAGIVLASYAATNGLSFILLADEQAEIAARYQVHGFPTVHIIDKHGIVRERVPGEIPAEQLETRVRRVLAMQQQAEAAYERRER